MGAFGLLQCKTFCEGGCCAKSDKKENKVKVFCEGCNAVSSEVSCTSKQTRRRNSNGGFAVTKAIYLALFLWTTCMSIAGVSSQGFSEDLDDDSGGGGGLSSYSLSSTYNSGASSSSSASSSSESEVNIPQPRNSLSIVPVSKNRVYQRALGKSSIFTCTANVEFPERLNDFRWWWPDGRAIEASDSSEGFYDETRVEIMKDQPGSLTLLFPAIQEQDLGTYRCTATYDNAQQLKTDFTLRAYVPITFEDAPLNQYAVKGQDFRVRCRVRADPEPQVDWKKDHRVINDSDHFVIHKDGVVIRSVTQDDEGIYTCRVRVTSMGTVEERHILIQVYESPRLKTHPETIEGVEGETVTLRCLATGKPPPEYEWLNQLKEILRDKDTQRFIVDKYKGTLEISRVSKEDIGIYTCTARNPAGSVTMESKLGVVTKPEIREFLNVTGKQSGNSVLTCKAYGDPVPDIRITKQGNRDPFRMGPQTDNKRIFFDQLKEPISGITIATLKISDVSRMDDGLYQCIAYNQKAQQNRLGHLTVQFPPTFLNTPMREAWSWDGRPVNMTCVAEAIPNATITWFIEKGQDEQVAVDQYTPNVKQYGFHSRSTLLVNPASYSMYGNYKCLAINSLGTAEHKIELREARKPGPMLEAIVYSKTATSLSYKLVGPVEDGGLPVKSFLAQFRKVGEMWDKRNMRMWPVNRVIFSMDGLEPMTMYQLRFAAENEVGLGEWALERKDQTPRRQAPDTPIILNELVGDYAITAYPDRFQLIWKLPRGGVEGNGEPLEGFEIWYEPVRNLTVYTKGILVPQIEWEQVGLRRKEEIVFQGQPRHMLRNLQPDTFYRVQLKAKNGVGSSAPDEIVFKTAMVPGEAGRPLTSHVIAAGTRLQEQCQHFKILLLSCLIVSLILTIDLKHITITNQIKAPLIITQLIISPMSRLRNKTSLPIQSITAMFYIQIRKITKS